MLTLSTIVNFLIEVGSLKNKYSGVENMGVKRVDYNRFCKDNGIEIYYSRVNDNYFVMKCGQLLVTKKTYLECEDYIYEVMLNDFYANN